MMTNQQHCQYWDDDTLQVVHLPYRGHLSMVVILPRAGRFREVDGMLTKPRIAQLVAQAARIPVDLAFPRFELRSSVDLRRALRAVGVRSVFDHAVADLSGISPHRQGLSVSRVAHQAWVKADEEGTEAAAVTTLGMFLGTPPPLKPVPFIANRPFVFLIRDEQTKTTLFMGRVVDPSVS